MGTKSYADVGVIPLNGEHNMLQKIGNIVFVDSCQFLATSLDNLVKALRKSGVNGFANTIRHFGDDDDAYYEKGCYPYEHMTDESKLDETKLPPSRPSKIASSAKISTTSSTTLTATLCIPRVRNICYRSADSAF